ncbi:MAG: hypothetical protein WCP85_21500 [Mariniphaga sp.]
MNTQIEQITLSDFLFKDHTEHLESLFRQFYDQVMIFTDKAPSDGFTNELIGFMSNGLNTASFTALMKSLMDNYDIEKMATIFTAEAIPINDTLKEIDRVIKSMNFVFRSRDAIDQLGKTIICYN